MENLRIDDESEQAVKIPSPQEMLKRLNNVDVKTLDIKTVIDELKGKRIWISVLTLPVSATLLMSFTLLGAFLFDSPIISFTVTAFVLIWVGKLFDSQQRIYEYNARQEVINRIAYIEEGFGLLPHFRVFLPEKYRHLWQSVRKGNYIFIDQYIQAVVLLQHKLDPKKFTEIWYLSYPEIDPENDSELDNPEELENTPKGS